jgi:hypothetical protein
MGPHEMPSVGAMVSVCGVRSRHVGTSEVTETKRLTDSKPLEEPLETAEPTDPVPWKVGRGTRDESAELLAGLAATISPAHSLLADPTRAVDNADPPHQDAVP